MRSILLALGLALLTARGGAGQLDGPKAPVQALLRERPRVEVRPSFAVLGCCSGEQRLDLALRWPFSPAADGLRLGLVGGFLTTRRGAYSRSGAEAHLARRAGRLEIAGGITAGVGQGEGARRVLTAEIAVGAGSLQLDVRSTWFDAQPRDTTTSGRALLTAGTVQGRYTEAEVLARHGFGPVGMLVVGGALLGGDSRSPSQWLWGEMDVPVRSRVALVLGGGTRPDRWGLGQRGGRFASISLRLLLGRSDDEPDPDPPPEADEEAFHLTASRLEEDRYLLRLRVPDASSVELRGDVTDWRTLTLHRAGGRSDGWEVEVHRPAGIYHVNIRVDGGVWRVPPGLAAVPDRFGGVSGLLMLPAR